MRQTCAPTRRIVSEATLREPEPAATAHSRPSPPHAYEQSYRIPTALRALDPRVAGGRSPLRCSCPDAAFPSFASGWLQNYRMPFAPPMDWDGPAGATRDGGAIRRPRGRTSTREHPTVAPELWWFRSQPNGARARCARETSRSTAFAVATMDPSRHPADLAFLR